MTFRQFLCAREKTFGGMLVLEKGSTCEHNVDFNSICCNFGNGIMEKNRLHEITELLCRLAFVIR